MGVEVHHRCFSFSNLSPLASTRPSLVRSKILSSSAWATAAKIVTVVSKHIPKKFTQILKFNIFQRVT